MTDWVRLWHDMPTDPKWRAIARKSGQPLPCVIALFNLLMVNASGNADDRGALRNWSDEDAAAALDMEPEDVTAIMAAMDGKVIEDGRLTGWSKRQPKREDDTAASRKRAQRQRDSEIVPPSSRDVTQCHAPETETELKEPNGSYERVREAWNTMAEKHGLAPVRSITGKRQAAVRARIAEHGEEAVIQAIGMVADAPLWLGQNSSGWMGNLDALMKPDKCLRMLEGAYAAKPRASPGQPPGGKPLWKQINEREEARRAAGN